jgi:hypothetical protein
LPLPNSAKPGASLIGGAEVRVTEGGDDILVVVEYFVENAVMPRMSKNTITSWPVPPS